MLRLAADISFRVILCSADEKALLLKVGVVHGVGEVEPPATRCLVDAGHQPARQHRLVACGMKAAFIVQMFADSTMYCACKVSASKLNT